MYDHIYVLEKIMQFQENDLQSLYVKSERDEAPFKDSFFCKIPVVRQLSVCDCS